MASQQYLFETEQEAMGDGSFRVKPRRLVDGREISARKAAGMLGLCTKTIYGLIAAGELVAWNTASARANSKYRIDLGSVVDYKARRQAAARGQ